MSLYHNWWLWNICVIPSAFALGDTCVRRAISTSGGGEGDGEEERRGTVLIESQIPLTAFNKSHIWRLQGTWPVFLFRLLLGSIEIELPPVRLPHVPADVYFWSIRHVRSTDLTKKKIQTTILKSQQRIYLASWKAIVNDSAITKVLQK